jgi:hypothetical protein
MYSFINSKFIAPDFVLVILPWSWLALKKILQPMESKSQWTKKAMNLCSPIATMEKLGHIQSEDTITVIQPLLGLTRRNFVE